MTRNEQIQQDINSGLKYSDIARKHHLTVNGLKSLIRRGKVLTAAQQNIKIDKPRNKTPKKPPWPQYIKIYIKHQHTKQTDQELRDNIQKLTGRNISVQAVTKLRRRILGKE